MSELTRKDLEEVVKGLATKADLTELATKADLAKVTEELRTEFQLGVEEVVATIDKYQDDNDRRFKSDRKRIDRLERIVL